VFKMYVAYCVNQQKAMDYLQSLLKKNTAFIEFHAKANLDPRVSGLGLGSYLTKPVQRLCKYPLMLKSLEVALPEGTPEHVAIAGAREKMENVVSFVNDRKRRAEMQNRVVELQNLMECPKGVELIHPSRFLVAEHHVRTLKDPKTKSLQWLRVFVFNDLILWAREKSNAKAKLEYIGSAKMNSFDIKFDDDMVDTMQWWCYKLRDTSKPAGNELTFVFKSREEGKSFLESVWSQYK